MVSRIVALSALIGLALSAPQGDRDSATTSTTTQVPILKQINKVNEDGSYTFGYEAADGTFKVETRDSKGSVVGRYGYIDTDGNLKTVEYTAGTGTGFSAKADHLPVAPVALPVPASAGLPAASAAQFATERFTQAKNDIQKNNLEEDFSTDADENGIPDALEAFASKKTSLPVAIAPVPPVQPAEPVRSAAPAPVAAPQQFDAQQQFPAQFAQFSQIAAPFRSAAPAPAAAPQLPAQFFQQNANFQQVPTFQQATSNAQADQSNTFIQQTPQGFQFAFTAPAQAQVPQQPQQARALPIPQGFGQFQPQQFQQFQFNPQDFGQFGQRQ